MSSIDIESVNLSDFDFWMRPWEERSEIFAQLRKERQPRFFPEPELSFGPRGPGYYALVRYHDIEEAAKLPEIFSSGRGAITIADMEGEFSDVGSSLIHMDGERHEQQRRIASRAFSPRVIRELQDTITAAATEVIDGIAERGSCDFAEEVAAFPLKVICDMMGIPESDRPQVVQTARLMTAQADPEYFSSMEDAVAQQMKSAQATAAMMMELAAHRKQNPTDDLTSALVNADETGECFSELELGSFFLFLLVAGSETTRSAIALGVHQLTKNPDQRELWMSDFERYTPTAVDEVIRMASPVNWMRRTVTRDYNLGDISFSEGDKVLYFYYSANRDEAVFTDPERFDITRAPNPHQGFGGFGPHVCLGQHLSRLEITTMVRELFRRLPDIRTVAEPEMFMASIHNGVKHLPCEFTPTSRA